VFTTARCNPREAAGEILYSNGPFAALSRDLRSGGWLWLSRQTICANRVLLGLLLHHRSHVELGIAGWDFKQTGRL